MIFNRNNDGAAELHTITGDYYKANDFNVIAQDIQDATEDLMRVIGQPLMDKVDAAYNGSGELADADKLIPLCQRPIALLACVRFFRRNDVSHEDSGRKVKISSDDTEKIPWEWQLDRDDAVHLEQYYQAVERLICFLNESKNEDWLATDTVTLANTLLIRSGKQFNNYFPVQQPERMFLMLVPFIREVQIKTIRPAYGIEDWPALLQENNVPESDVHFSACKATALLAMATGFRRLPLQLIPAGVVKGYLSENGMSNTTPATLDEVQQLATWLEADAADWIDRMKGFRDGATDEELDLLPKNCRKNKYFVT